MLVVCLWRVDTTERPLPRLLNDLADLWRNLRLLGAGCPLLPPRSDSPPRTASGPMDLA